MNNLQYEKYQRAKSRVDSIRGFYIHLTSYVVINTIVTVLKINRNLNNGETFNEAFFDFATFALWMFWGIGVVFHALGVFSKSSKRIRDWEQRKLNQFIEEEKQNLSL